MSKTSKTKSESSPPEWSAPLFKAGAAEANKLYQAGVGGNTYMGSAVAPLSGTTMTGVNQLANAGANSDTSGTRNLFAQIGAAAVDNPYLSENAYLEQSLQPQLDKAAAQTRSAMSGMGRLGGGAETNALAQTLGDIRTTALANDWNRRANMLTTGLSQAQGAASSMAGLDQKQFENKLAGAGATLQAGNILDTQSQNQLSDYVSRWYAKDNEDWNRLAMMLSAAQGSAGNYGVTESTSRQPVNIGGIMSGLGGLKSSDIRLKEDIIRVGELNGLTLYDFSYKGEKARYRGVMAQEVPLYRSEAIVIGADGFMAVDYAKLGFPMMRVG